MLAQKPHFITSLIYYRWPKFFEVFLFFFYFWNFKWLCYDMLPKLWNTRKYWTEGEVTMLLLLNLFSCTCLQLFMLYNYQKVVDISVTYQNTVHLIRLTRYCHLSWRIRLCVSIDHCVHVKIRTVHRLIGLVRSGVNGPLTSTTILVLILI